VTVYFTMLGLFALALIEVAIDTKKHAKLTLVKNVTQLCVGIQLWWLFGVGFAFGDVDDNDFIGHENFAGDDYEVEHFGDTWFLTCALDGLFGICVVFAINGMISERANHTTYVLLSMLVMGWVYPVVVAWGWGGGWLNSTADDDDNDILYRDDSGAGTVHLLAASMGLVGTLFLGPRHGRFKTHTVSFKVNGREQ
jgi:Amt family ammonium transporter